MLTTRSGAYISRFGDFCVHDDDNDNDNNDNDDTTDHFTPAHARGVINDSTTGGGESPSSTPNKNDLTSGEVVSIDDRGSDGGGPLWWQSW